MILTPLPGIEPVAPALEGEAITTGPPGNPSQSDFTQHLYPHPLLVQLCQTFAVIADLFITG